MLGERPWENIAIIVSHVIFNRYSILHTTGTYGRYHAQ